MKKISRAEFLHMIGADTKEAYNRFVTAWEKIVRQQEEAQLPTKPVVFGRFSINPPPGTLDMAKCKYK